MLKRAKDNWQNAFESTLDKSERKAVRDFTNYYKTESDKAINIALQKGSLNEQDLLGVFTRDGFAKRYEALYEGIGLTFANWYAKNFDKYLTKGVSPNQFQEPWRAAFRNLGITVGAQRVTLVQNTAKKTLIKVYRKLSNDPIFQTEGEVVKGRMLRQQFNKYNTYQAKRLVRTEATNAANYATMQSAQDIFPGADMQKEWITSMDGREREWHGAANGQIVDFNKPFIVKGESIMRPGEGSAANVINCRCSVAPFPKQNAQTVGLIEGLNVGVSVGQAEALISRNIDEVKPNPSKIVIKPPQPKQPVAGEVVDDTLKAKKEAMRPDNWNDVVPSGTKLNDDYLALLETKPSIAGTAKGSYQVGNFINIDITRHNSETISRVLAHEFGHLVHQQKKWCVLAGRFSKSIDEVTNFYKSQRAKIGIDKRGADKFKYFKDVDRFSPSFRGSIRSQFPNLTDKQFKESFAAVADYFGAMTKNQIGWGHSNSYYSSLSWRHAEMLAHAFENKYVGNPVFKKLFPEIYKDTIKWIDELIAL